ncbi:16S rRNA (cytosine(967)-C(5))-methyltransferase RsmB [Desulfofundulus thermobenzoicus]|uniref:16S rRNA (cytosine(967)-C(5))-methyltransferase n=1 Tax=Desulfofundulus thermobenzoicus TaxID=29376 RepID=A0A6N7ITZ7_9FIRM|nr:16S rRNA (cytosine(967)-C(5))-methyltransferase RsmB [Desulfofundulus thermobenzoicus]MQL53540.1 16S rRNA (cytosine(967)-C(5))-methyltransferase RsmB [Desulfofundulus thermobenzoicus]
MGAAVINAREMALKVLQAVDEKGAYANLALDRVLEHYRPGRLDRAFTTELVYGVLRRLNTLDWLLNHLLRQPLAGQTVWIRNILRLGAYQIMFMDRVPVPAACNEAAELARRYGRPGAVGFVNGVLRNLARRGKEISFPRLEDDPVAHISLCYSHPRWLVQRWLAEFGPEETVALCRANNTPAPNTVRTNTLKISPEELERRLKGDGLVVERTAYAPEGLRIDGIFSLRDFSPFIEGLFQVQDESSMLAGHALSPFSGARVLDAAAAPGGKTTHLAQLMGDRGEIVAQDIHPHKLKLIAGNCRRLGISCVQTREGDARRPAGDLIARCDFVLLDAPCSGLGVLRRRPDIRWRKEAAAITELAALQREMLDGAAACVKPGGVLVYSTCTITREENLGQVENFLARHPEFAPGDLRAVLPAGLDHRGTMKRGYLQLLPHRHGTDGFFIARLCRKPEP